MNKGTEFQQRFGGGDSFSGSALNGSRTWGVDSYGRLCGQWNHIWVPGENKATCNVPQQTQVHLPATTYAYTYTGTDIDFLGRPKVKVGCKGVESDCVCGFYAYYEEKDLPEHGAVGIIEGYGLTVEGPLGFRSTKAKVKALVLKESNLIAKIPDSVNGMFGFNYTSPADPRQVKKNYPEIRFFETTKAMYAEFPPDEPAFFDSDAPGFWTKPIK